MLIDQPKIVEGSVILNATVPFGTADPLLPSQGELFFRTDLGASGTLRVFNTAWIEAGATALQAHTIDTTQHLSAAQNTLLDALNLPTLTAAHLNFVAGATSNLQAQITAATSSSGTHAADMALHLTSGQNEILDALLLPPMLTGAMLNHSAGLAVNIQGKFNAIDGVNNTQTSRLDTLENTTVPAVQTNLTNHIANLSLHLTTAQNTLLDGLAATLTADELNYVDGVTSAIQTQLNTITSNRIHRDGTIAMAANLSLGGNKVTNLGIPTLPGDAATKDYVDSFVQGLHWVGSAKAATTSNIALTGLQTIDTRPLVTSDRVLVKNQSAPAENGIYFAAVGAWTRALDYDTISEINNSAVFVLEYAGATQSKSTWIQTSDVVTVGTTPISFSAFSGPVVNAAGPGISLGVGGTVSVEEGAGLAFDGNARLVLDLHPAGGFMLTTNNTSAATLTTVAAQLALTESGVTAGTYNDNVTMITPFTVDSKGRITGTGAGVTITPAFSSITAKPTTLSGYGITNAILKAGDTGIGTLSFSSGTSISGVVPGTAAAHITTAAYATGQGDNRTHFGYNTGTSFINYIRGSLTDIPGNVQVGGTLTRDGSTVLDAGNFNTYSPTLTGTGATGTWAINITGNAGTATSATSATTATNATNATITANVSTNAIFYPTFSPNGTGNSGLRADANKFTYNPGTGNLAATSLNGFTPSASSGATRLVATDASGNIFTNYVNSIDNSVSSGVTGIRVKAGDNFVRTGTAQSVATFMSGVVFPAINVTSTLPVITVGQAGGLAAYSTSSQPATMSFHRAGVYAVNMGLDADNVFRLGGWSDGAQYRWTSDTAGNFVARGDLTAFSDRRLKKDIEPIADPLYKIEQLHGVTFKRIENDQAGTGLIAQDVLAVLPEAVHDSDGTLSVAYGNLAGLFVEAIKALNKEVIELRAELNALKGQ